MNIKEDKNKVYKETEQEQLKADVYYPTEGGKHPGIVLIHGGAWLQGYKEMYAEWAPHFARHGYVAMAFDYRLSTSATSTYPEALHDVKSAIHYFVQHAEEWRMDTNNLVIIGDSAGGHLASCIALDHSNTPAFQIVSVVSVYGVYDLPAWQQYTNQTRKNDPVHQFIGNAFHDAPETYKEASPQYKLKALKKPFNTSFFIIWGEDDDVVPASQSVAFSCLLERKGFDVQTLAIPGVGHYWFNLFEGIEGGSLQDNPNPLVADNILHYLKRN